MKPSKPRGFAEVQPPAASAAPAAPRYRPNPSEGAGPPRAKAASPQPGSVLRHRTRPSSRDRKASATPRESAAGRTGSPQ